MSNATWCHVNFPLIYCNLRAGPKLNQQLDALEQVSRFLFLLKLQKVSFHKSYLMTTIKPYIKPYIRKKTKWTIMLKHALALQKVREPYIQGILWNMLSLKFIDLINILSRMCTVHSLVLLRTR